jgi:O-antigen/teichoic acid export membrane protein
MRYVPSSTLLSMVVYGVSGLAFVGANLLLARELSPEQFALFTLLVALSTLGYHLAPLGLDGVILRGRVDVAWPLLKRVALVAAGIGLATGGIALLFYGVAPALAALLFASTAGGGLMLIASAKFQSERRFVISLGLAAMTPNLLLLLGALATIAVDWQTAELAFDVWTIGLGAAAGFGWALALRETRGTRSVTIPWSEALVLAGVSAAGMLFIQLERLVIPHLLTVADLALYGVLAAIAGSIFRVLQMGVGFSLLPRLRAAATVLERRALIAREIRFALAVAGIGAAAIFLLTPPIERLFLEGKYHLSMGLLAAAVFSGIGKIAHAFSRATATALATPRELALVNAAGWLSAIVALGGAIAAAPWGLIGVVYGIGFGWFAWAAMSFVLVIHHLRLPAGLPAET